MKNIIFIIFYLIISTFFAQEILIYKNENPTFYIPHPETDTPMQGAEALQYTLDNIGEEYDVEVILPEDLSQYEVIFVSLGSYCES